MQEGTIRDRLDNIIKIPKALKFKDPKEILNLDITAFRAIDNRIAKALDSIVKIKKIKDFLDVKLDEAKILTLNVLGIKISEINVWIFVARMISEGKLDEALGPKKISILGLDNAGKTAILRILQNKLKLDIFGKLPATIGVDRQYLNKFGLEYSVLDMGGQEQYRKEYIKYSDKYFININYLIYVVDVQDPEIMEKSIKYFQEVIGILELLDEYPEILIILNKVDPDIQDDKVIIETCDFLEKTFKEILMEKPFNHVITRYSIYNSLGDNQAVIKGIRDFITGQEEEGPEKVLGPSLEQIMNIVINLASEVETRFRNLEQANESIFEWIHYLRNAIPERKKEIDSLAIFRTAKLAEEKDLLKDALEKELKNILKIREEDL